MGSVPGADMHHAFLHSSHKNGFDRQKNRKTKTGIEPLRAGTIEPGGSEYFGIW